MTWRTNLAFLATAMLLQSNFVFAQLSPAYEPPQMRFADAPKIGEQLPDLTIVDDQGNPVNIRELAREQYTVLVLGCLT